MIWKCLTEYFLFFYLRATVTGCSHIEMGGWWPTFVPLCSRPLKTGVIKGCMQLYNPRDYQHDQKATNVEKSCSICNNFCFLSGRKSRLLYELKNKNRMRFLTAKWNEHKSLFVCQMLETKSSRIRISPTQNLEVLETEDDSSFFLENESTRQWKKVGLISD